MKKALMTPIEISQKELAEIKVRDLRLIKIYWSGIKDITTYYILQKDIEKFLQATIALHHSQGKNPHNGRETNKINRITSQKPSAGRYWWTTPNLKNNDDPNGALIINFSSEEELWTAPM